MNLLLAPILAFSLDSQDCCEHQPECKLQQCRPLIACQRKKRKKTDHAQFSCCRRREKLEDQQTIENKSKKLNEILPKEDLVEAPDDNTGPPH